MSPANPGPGQPLPPLLAPPLPAPSPPPVRQALGWLHTWGGLVFGWLLFAIFLTGTLSVFGPEITHWMRPEARPLIGTAAGTTAGVGPARALAVANAHLAEAAPNADSWMIFLPDARNPLVTVMHSTGRVRTETVLDPLTGAVLPVRDTLGGEFFGHFHADLHAGRPGLWLVGAAGMAMVIGLLTGLVIHRRLFADLFTFRPGAAPRRAWLDAHNVLGVMTLPFLLIISYTGVSISAMVFLPAPIKLLYDGNTGGPRAEIVRSLARPASGTPAPLLPLTALLPQAEAALGSGKIWMVWVTAPNDTAAVVDFSRHFDDRLPAITNHKIFDGVTGAVMGEQRQWPAAVRLWRSVVGIHVIRFSDAALRWVYLICGFAGCGVIASGLVLFSRKRLEKPLRPDAPPLAGMLAARLNVAAIASVMIACPAFLWANRLLPVGLEHRAGAEVTVFFLVWLAGLCHALVSDPARSWPAQLGLAAALCLLLPLLNAVTTGQHMLRSLWQGDGVAAGLELTVLGIGAALAYAVPRAGRLCHPRAEPPSSDAPSPSAFRTRTQSP